MGSGGVGPPHLQEDPRREGGYLGRERLNRSPQQIYFCAGPAPAAVPSCARVAFRGPRRRVVSARLPGAARVCVWKGGFAATKRTTTRWRFGLIEPAVVLAPQAPAP